MATSTKYWKGIEELNNDSEVKELQEKEFSEYVPVEDFLKDQETLESSSTTRRDFLKYLGFSTAAATLAACETPVIKSIPYVTKPEEVTPGIANWYASTYSDGNDYASILVKTREGRPILIEGNQMSQLTEGGLNPRVNASVLTLYDTNRYQSPMKGGKASDWETVDGEIGKKLKAIAAKGGSIRVLSHSTTSPSTLKLIQDFGASLSSGAAEGEGEDAPAGVDFKHVLYDSISYSGMLEANKKYFGKAVIPFYHFDHAKTIVSIGADFLGNWLSSVQYNNQYTKNRKPDAEWMSKHYQFEANLSLSGSNADVRTPVKPSDYGKIAVALYNKIAGASLSGGTKEYGASIAAAAKDLKDNMGASLVVCGCNDPDVQAVVNAINEKLGNYNKTLSVHYADNTRRAMDADIAGLLGDMKGGKVDALLVYGCDPVYTHPMGDAFKQAMGKVGLTVSFASRPDSTAMAAKYVCAGNHYLESWDDAEPVKGSYSMQQPVISKVYDTRQFQDTLLAWMGSNEDYLTYMQHNWASNVFGMLDDMTGLQAKWNQVVHDGVYQMPIPEHHAVEQPVVEQPEPAEGEEGETEEGGFDLAAAASAAGKHKSGTWEIELYQKMGIGDGKDACNPWLQELPDPISRVTWDNYVAMAPSDIEEAGFNMKIGQEWPASTVNLTVNGKKLEGVPVYPQPGQKKGTIGLALGYGKEVWKQEGAVGFDAFPMVSCSKEGGIDYHSADVSFEKAEGDYALAATQIHHTIMGRTSVVRETDIDTFKNGSKDDYNPDHKLHFLGAAGPEHEHHHHGHEEGEGHGEEHHDEHHEGHDHAVPVSEIDLWDAHPVEGVGHRWGMAIDLNTCTGCGACVIACHAENNVPVVGKDEVRRGRDMHWLRIDRYYSSEHDELGDSGNTYDKTKEEEGIGGIAAYTAMEMPEDNPRVVFQPMMCQHCNHAPCETVCPVVATTHSNEGLNQMTYNRCIGTRYCANNCPYKVRRFNWFNYMRYKKFTGVNPSQDDLGRLVLNPDVTVRARGVMEKCSMCVGRIQAGKLEAKKAGVPVQDGQIQTACSAACSNGSITFGDLNDEKTAVAQEATSDRAFRVIEEVGTQPNIYYMTLVRNVEKEMNS